VLPYANVRHRATIQLTVASFAVFHLYYTRPIIFLRFAFHQIPSPSWDLERWSSCSAE